MRIKAKIIKKLSLALVALLLFAAPSIAEDTFVTLLTGGVSATYYRIGDVMARAISASSRLHVTAVRSAGSAENIRLLCEEGGPEFAFVQNDVAHWARDGRVLFVGDARSNFRVVAGLYPEMVQLITRADSPVRGVSDLASRSVGVGAIGSGAEGDARAIFGALGTSYGDMNVRFTDFASTASMIRDGRLDAGLIVAGVPTPIVEELAASTPIRVASFGDDELSRLVEHSPYFEPAEIPAGIYGNAEPVRTPSVRALLVVREDVPDEVVHAFVTALFENVDAVRAAHASVAELSAAGAASGLTLPLHPGAERYYREAGVID